MGDLRGVLARLDHLVGLGVSAIWLSPIFTSPMADFGYDVSDYCDVDPVFGTLADFDALLAAAHARGVKVIVDWVPNHSSDQHPWFLAARADPDSPFRDFYVWRDAPVNDWTSQLDPSSPAWTYDAVAGRYYLHTFLPQQPELNWDHPPLVAAMHDTLRFWLDRGVDGLRLDAVERIGKDPELRAPDGYWGWQPALDERFRGIRAVVDEYEDRVIVGETAMVRDMARLVGYLAGGDGQHMAHNFIFAELPQWRAADFRATVAAWFALAEPAAWPSWLLNNHDSPRIPDRYGARAVRPAAVMLYALRGTPFVYQGEELGLPGAVIPRERIVDVCGRDPERAPIPWTADGPAYGFTPDGAQPWLPFVTDAATLNAATQAEDPRSVLALYRALAALRAAEPALRAGDIELVDAHADVFAWTRGGGELAVAVNFAAAPRPLPDAVTGGELLLSTDPDSTALGAELGPDEAVIVRRAARA